MGHNAARLTDHVVKCTHCYNVGRMLLVGSYSNVQNYGEDLTLGGRLVVGTYNAGTHWDFLLCEACGNILVRKSPVDDRFEDVPDVETVYPESGGLVEYLPELIATAYQDALRVRIV